MLGSKRSRRVIAFEPRAIAVFAAAAILAGQLAIAGHFHQAIQTQRVGTQAELSVGNGLCALCLLAFHSKVNPGGAPSIVRPEIQTRTVVQTAPVSFVSFNPSCALTRAPPATI
jgi:hypothetical protein